MVCYSNILNANSQWLSGMTPAEMMSVSLLLPTLAEAKMYVRKSEKEKTDQGLYDSLSEIHERIKALGPGAFLLVPGGWLTPDVAPPRKSLTISLFFHCFCLLAKCTCL
jgi:hypothetical protein